MCQPMAPALPVDRSGDFGRSPFFGQLSGKLPPATVYASVVLKSKHKGCVENLICACNSPLLRLTHRELPRSKAIAIDAQYWSSISKRRKHWALIGAKQTWRRHRGMSAN